MQESDYEFGAAHDQWLARYESGTEVVYCTNKACELHRDGVEIRWESENGQSSWTPEECYLCHSAWTQDQPEEEEDDVDPQEEV